MFSGLRRIYRLLKQTLRGDHDPRHLALGIALGMLVGLVPKGNLIAIGLATLVLITRANLLTALLSTFAFVWIGLILDPFLHRLGALLLTADMLESTWTRLYNMPIIPWTDFNNTVVLGSLVFGLAVVYPVYHLSRMSFEKLGPPCHQRFRRFRLYRFLAGLKTERSPEPEGSL